MGQIKNEFLEWQHLRKPELARDFVEHNPDIEQKFDEWCMGRFE